MKLQQTELLLDGLMFPEGPRWHQEKLWFTDQHAKQIRTVDLKGCSQMIAELSDLPGGLGWLPDGHLLVVSMCQRKLLILEGQELKPYADLSTLASFHCNDLLVDACGRAYVGNFGYDLHAGSPISHAEIILVTAMNKAKVVAREMVFPNGMVMTADGKTLIVAETFASRLTAFQINAAGGLEQRSLWADLGVACPDGICLDQAQGIWVACPNIGRVIRVEQGGQVSHDIKPIGTPYACMLGGVDRKQLFVLSSETDDPEQAVSMRSGRIEYLQVDIPAAGLP